MREDFYCPPCFLNNLFSTSVESANLDEHHLFQRPSSFCMGCEIQVGWFFLVFRVLAYAMYIMYVCIYICVCISLYTLANYVPSHGSGHVNVHHSATA